MPCVTKKIFPSLSHLRCPSKGRSSYRLPAFRGPAGRSLARLSRSFFKMDAGEPFMQISDDSLLFFPFHTQDRYSFVERDRRRDVEQVKEELTPRRLRDPDESEHDH